MAGPKGQRAALLDALGAIVLWSTLAVIGVRLKHVPPFFLIGVGLLCGALCGARAIDLGGIRLRVLGLGVYGLFAYHLCLFLALRLAPPIEANLINYLWPLLIVVLCPIIVPGSRLSSRHVSGAVLGFGGAALLVGARPLEFTGSAWPGYALAFAAAIIWSTYSLLTKRMGDFPTSAVATFCLVSGVLSLGCHFAFEPRYMPRGSDIPYLLWIGVGPMGAAFYLWDRAIKRGDPRAIGALSYLPALLSTLLIALFGQGHLSLTSTAAMAMIVGGAVLGTWPRPAASPEARTNSSP